MNQLFLHGKPVRTIFDLLGSNENDLTYSLGWALARCGTFQKLLLNSIFDEQKIGEPQAVDLQAFGEDKGYTDIVIRTDCCHVIIEAKRGWNLPTIHQLTRYVKRFKQTEGLKSIVVVSECSDEFARTKLPTECHNVPIKFLSWQEIYRTGIQAIRTGPRSEKALLVELTSYFKGLMSMQDQESNIVFVVSLSRNGPESSNLSFMEIVYESHRYFHPYAISGWPKILPNYLGFRFDGELQTIHHVEDYKIVADGRSMGELIPNAKPAIWSKSEDRGPIYSLYTRPCDQTWPYRQNWKDLPQWPGASRLGFALNLRHNL